MVCKSYFIKVEFYSFFYSVFYIYVWVWWKVRMNVVVKYSKLFFLKRVFLYIIKLYDILLIIVIVKKGDFYDLV